MAGIEIRKTETEVGETGAGGNRTDTHYVLGGEIDGVFVPFVTKSSGYIEHLIEVEKANQQNEPNTEQPKGGAFSPSGKK